MKGDADKQEKRKNRKDDVRKKILEMLDANCLRHGRNL